MSLEVGELGCGPDEENHAWAWDELVQQAVCSHCGILESWVEQERSNDTARRLLDGTVIE